MRRPAVSLGQRRRTALLRNLNEREPSVTGDESQLRPIIHTELLQETADVNLDCSLRDPQRRADLQVGEPASEESEHVALSPRQRVPDPELAPDRARNRQPDATAMWSANGRCDREDVPGVGPWLLDPSVGA